MKELGKAELVAQITANTNMTASQANDAYDAVVGALINEIGQGNKVVVRGLGTFSIKEIAQRERIKPGTGERFMSPASRSVKFSLSDKLKKSVRN